MYFHTREEGAMFRLPDEKPTTWVDPTKPTREELVEALENAPQENEDEDQTE
jgi:hypothetical protein